MLPAVVRDGAATEARRWEPIVRVERETRHDPGRSQRDPQRGDEAWNGAGVQHGRLAAGRSFEQVEQTVLVP